METTATGVLAVFDRWDDPAGPRTATEVADRAACRRRTALDRPYDLENDGPVASRMVGGRAPVW